MHKCQCHYQCQYSIGLAVIFSVHFQECSQGPWWDSFACLLSAPRRPKTHIPCMLRMLELTADPVQEATKVDNSAHLQSKSVICHSVHRPWCQQSMKYITVNSDGGSNSCGSWTVGHWSRVCLERCPYVALALWENTWSTTKWQTKKKMVDNSVPNWACRWWKQLIMPCQGTVAQHRTVYMVACRGHLLLNTVCCYQFMVIS